MNIFAIGLGGAGGSIVGEMLDEIGRAKEEGQRLNFEYALIDFPKGIEKLPWKPEHRKRISLDRASGEWIEEKFKGFLKEDIPTDPEIGTGRRRCYSKVTFEYNRGKIERALNDLLNNFFDEFRAEEVACWIFTSFGGGTGSGMFADLAILLGKIKERIEREERRLSIYLVGVLPSAADRGDDMLSPPNSIQAFKEIDYLVSGEYEEEGGIRNPFDQIFLVGLYRMMGPIERAKLMIDKMVAKCIIEFCCGIKDFNDMISEIRDKKAGLKDKKLLSFSIAHYRFPMDEILELYECENRLFEHRKEEAKLEDEVKKLEKEIEEKDKRIKILDGEINDRRNKIIEAKKKKGIINEKIRIPKWRDELKEYEKEKKEEEDLKTPFARDKEVRDKALGAVRKEIEKLSNRMAELKVWLEKEEKEHFSKENINWVEYEKIKEDIQNLRQRPLKELVDRLKEEGIKEKDFDKILGERMEYLTKSQPLIISKKKSIPLLELGHLAPEGCIREGALQQPAMIKEMATKKILRKTNYAVNLYAIFGGIDPGMVNDLRIFVEDYYLEYQNSNPEVIDKSLAGFLWGQKKWSEYNPDWLVGVKKN